MLEIDRQIVLVFYKRVQEIVSVLEIKVFGSRSRGDSTNESDLDVFIKVESIDRSLRNRIIDLAWEVGFEYDRVISTFVVTDREVKYGALGASPLLFKIAEEGIKI